MLHYSRVIAEWCAQTGMFPWSPDEDTHVDIEGVTVGLIYNSEESPEMLHAYIDLGAMNYPDLHQTLLHLNVSHVSAGNGYFGIHPESGTVVLRVDIPLNADTSGARLPELIWYYTQLHLDRLRA